MMSNAPFNVWVKREQFKNNVDIIGVRRMLWKTSYEFLTTLKLGSGKRTLTLHSQSTRTLTEALLVQVANCMCFNSVVALCPLIIHKAEV